MFIYELVKFIIKRKKIICLQICLPSSYPSFRDIAFFKKVGIITNFVLCSKLYWYKTVDEAK